MIDKVRGYKIGDIYAGKPILGIHRCTDPTEPISNILIPNTSGWEYFKGVEDIWDLERSPFTKVEWSLDLKEGMKVEWVEVTSIGVFFTNEEFEMIIEEINKELK